MEIQKLVAIASKARGYLGKKSSKMFVGWQKRFWLVVDSYLCYYQDETLAQQKGRIQIKKIHKLQAVEKTDLKFMMQGKIYQLRATTTAERDQWVKCLKVLQQYEKKYTRRNSPIKKELQADRKSTLIISPRFIDLERRSMEDHFVTNEFVLSDGQDLQQIFKLLGLTRCAEQYQQRRIYQRFSYCLCKEGYYFVLSSKPVGLSYIDQEILDQTYIEPLKLNILYRLKMGKEESSEIIPCHKILDIKIIDDTCININFGSIIQIKAKNGLELFANRLDKAIEVGKQFNNQLNIKLRINIEPCIKIYDQLKSMIQRRQKVKQYFQQKFLKYKNHIKNINSFQIFYTLQGELIDLMVDFVNACKVKVIPRIDLAQQYTQFMHEKIYGLFKQFWNKQHENLKDDQILKLCNMINKHSLLIQNYLKDDRVRQGILILINIYFRKMVSRFEKRFEKDLKAKNYLDIQSVDKISRTKIVFLITEIISQEINCLYLICDFKETRSQFNLYIVPIYKIIYNSIQKIIEVQKKDYRLISALLNDVESIGKYLSSKINQQHFNQSDKTYTNQQIKLMSKFLTEKLIQKLFEILFSDIDTNKLSNFHQIEMKELIHDILLRIQSIRSVYSHILNQIEIKSLHEIILFYINCLVVDTKFNIDNVIKKINQDRILLESHYLKSINKIELEFELNILANLIEFLLADSPITIRKHCITLKNQYADIFILDIFKMLLILKYPSKKQPYDEYLKICVEIFQRKQNSVKSQYQAVIPEVYKEDIIRERRSTLTLNINNPNILKTKMEGYLGKKKIDNRNSHKIKLFYEERYFRILDGHLLWYLNSHTKQLQNRLNLAEIRKVYKHESKQNVFIIQLNDVKYKFKAQNSDKCKKWIDAIVKGIDNRQSSNQAVITKIIPKQNQMIKDFFSQNKDLKNISYDQKIPMRSLRTSVLSTITEKININKVKNQQNFTHNPSQISSKMAAEFRVTQRESKKEKGCWFMFKNCISIE